ncbi:TetR/AcrR family transcriptional regulator [Rhodovibrionaceae bacterium A322]
MGRPSLKAQRSNEILDAFERCIARYGLEGSSLELIAEEAGVKRTVLRHFIGNRDDLIEALAQRLGARYAKELAEYRRYVPRNDQGQGMLNLLFPAGGAQADDSEQVFEALLSVADRYPAVQAVLTTALENFIQANEDLLTELFPEQPSSRIQLVAYGLAALNQHEEALVALPLAPRFRSSARDTAALLLDSLKQSD